MRSLTRPLQKGAPGPLVSYIIRRVLGLIPTLFIITVIVFALMHAMPGNAFASLVLNPHLRNSQQLVNKLIEENGLNQPLWQQYVNWIDNVAHGNFGNSFNFHTSVNSLLWPALGRTVRLALAAEIIILLLGVPLGALQASRANKPFDIVTNWLAVFLYAFPSFIVALFLILWLSFGLGWFPNVGSVSPTGAGAGSPFDILKHLVLPALALAIPSFAGYSRLTRGTTLQTIVMDFVRTARAKGLRGGRVLFRHVLRYAIIPIITQFGFDLGGLVGGAIIIETIFTYPGMGELSVQAVYNRDYPLILATTLIFAVAVLAGNLIADILLASADPRVRFD